MNAKANKDDEERADRYLQFYECVVDPITGAGPSVYEVQVKLEAEFADVRLQERKKIVGYLREFWDGTNDDGNKPLTDKLAALIESGEHSDWTSYVEDIEEKEA